MDPILNLVQKYNLFVVEDAACGFGAKYKKEWQELWKYQFALAFTPEKP